MSQEYHKQWFGLVYRQTQGYPEPVLSTVIDAGNNPRLLRVDGVVQQEIDSFAREQLIMMATGHRDVFCQKFVEFRKAKWWLELFETSPQDANYIPRVIETVDLENR